MFKNRSLSAQLSWQIGLAQLVIFPLTMVALVVTYTNRNITSVDKETADKVASAIYSTAQTLAVDEARVPRQFRDSAEAWFVAKDHDGRSLTRGQVPPAYAALIAWMPAMEIMELSIRDDAAQALSPTGAGAALPARLVVQSREAGDLRVLVGGMPKEGPAHSLFWVVRFFGSWVALPLVLTTALVAPLIIHRGLRGLRGVAQQANTMDGSTATQTLDARSVPDEVRPLVSAFNGLLRRIGKANEARDRFLTDAAHELRMPIAVLRTRLSFLPPTETRSRLINDTSRLESIAEQLLDLERLNRSMSDAEPLDLVQICREVAEDVAPVVISNGYTFEFEAPPVPVRVTGDPASLRRMFMGLIQNAVAHGNGAGLIRMVLSADATVSIVDEGPGVPQAERENVFEPFYRLAPASSGSGLGLHLAREVARHHGGGITIADAASGGAVFQVHLPLTPATGA
ncbi:MAG: HAMP domain-containing sensor histidine kinase [Candidatus Dactylopiibacterium sp.]|nr:HAMP domain-containing sensor histidine kinase [Candidatus Dactylopiibacterium sp.]